MTIRIFVSYSHLDDAFREQLAKHLAPMERDKEIEFWFDGDILAGAALTPEIRRELKRSDILVALASHHYLASDYCFNKDYMPSIRRAAKGGMRVVAVLLSPCDWKNTRLANYKLLPKDGKPIERWGSRNSAYVDVVTGLRRVIRVVRAEKKAAAEAAVATEKKTSPRRRVGVVKPPPKSPSSPRKAAISGNVRPASAKALKSPGRQDREPKAVAAPPASDKKSTVKRKPAKTRSLKKPA